MIKTVITAPKGHMGGLIIKECVKRENMRMTGCVGSPGRSYIGEDAGTAAGAGVYTRIKVCDDINDVIQGCDMVIDFSTVSLSMKVLDSCIRNKKALICGTTGFTEEENNAFRDAGEYIPVMKAASTSFTVTLMKNLIAEAAKVLGDKCAIEIIEMHSRDKKDAPSGTAIELAKVMVESSPDKSEGDIKFHSVRAGNTPSTHRIIFGCMGEKMEISHDAYDWSCYAKGACDAAEFMYGKTPGQYSMKDVVQMGMKCIKEQKSPGT